MVTVAAAATPGAEEGAAAIDHSMIVVEVSDVAETDPSRLLDEVLTVAIVTVMSRRTAVTAGVDVLPPGQPLPTRDPLLPSPAPVLVHAQSPVMGLATAAEELAHPMAQRALEDLHADHHLVTVIHGNAQDREDQTETPELANRHPGETLHRRTALRIRAAAGAHLYLREGDTQIR